MHKYAYEYLVVKSLSDFVRKNTMFLEFCADMAGVYPARPGSVSTYVRNNWYHTVIGKNVLNLVFVGVRRIATAAATLFIFGFAALFSLSGVLVHFFSVF